jgi:TRAP-type C4-dicarboxylate transport system substrate-binding protein
MRQLFHFLGLIALCLPFSAFAAEKTYTLTVASVAPADSPWAALLQQYKSAMEKRTGGRIKVKLMIGGVLGDENETVTKCSRGQIQAVAASTGAIATKVPELNLLELPYLFRTVDEADKIIDGLLTEPYEKLFEKRGLALGFWNENGYRNFGTSDKPIQKASDLKGKKMRVQENPVHISMYKTFGSAAVPIPVTEVTQALATGNVDGFDQTILFMIAAGWHKSIKHVSLSEHIYQPAAIIYNGSWYKSLPADLRVALVEEGRGLQKKGRAAVRKILPELNEILAYDKIQVHPLSAAQKRDFEEASKPVRAEFRRQMGAEASKLLDQVEAELKKMRGEG